MPRPLMAMWPPVVIWLALFAAFAWMLLDRLLALDPGSSVFRIEMILQIGRAHV